MAVRVIARRSTNTGVMSHSTVTTLRSAIAHRRAARSGQRRLARELASYQTPAERLELGLMLGRSSAEDTAEVDAILSHQATLASSRLGR